MKAVCTLFVGALQKLSRNCNDEIGKKEKREHNF